MRAEVVPGCGACGRREACGVWLWCLWAAAGPGRASRSTTPSEARVWRSRGRAAAHRRNRPDQVGRLRGMEGGARSAGSGCGACGRRRVLAGPLPATRGRREACGVWLWCLWAAAGPGAGLLAAMRGRREACGAWPGFETTRRAKLVARTASGRAGLAPPGSVVVEVSPGSVLAKMPPGSVVVKVPRGSEVGRNSASGGVEVEEGD